MTRMTIDRYYYYFKNFNVEQKKKNGTSIEDNYAFVGTGKIRRMFWNSVITNDNVLKFFLMGVMRFVLLFGA